MANILSIQSHVAYGHVGNAAAEPALHALGHQVWPIHTVSLSNHPGHGGWRGRFAAPEEATEIVRGLEERGFLARCNAVLGGYLGDPAMGPALLDAAARVKRANPDALFCCDPVMGDTGSGFFVRPGIPEFFRDEAPGAADIMIPNAFELAYLAGRPCDDDAALRAAAEALRTRGPGLVVATGGRSTEGVSTLVLDKAGTWRVAAPWIDGAPGNGAGDLFSALFLGRYLETRDPARAAGLAVAATHAVLADAAARGLAEIDPVATAQAISAPPRLFEVERLG
ncbi:MAG: pyridoxal kinase PdxY [Rhodospirillaceae bacterium]|jgi:pyridoxine kinase|nr:pyridoxal kinase PdxY [Rhodospirillaceae bacterium]